MTPKSASFCQFALLARTQLAVHRGVDVRLGETDMSAREFASLIGRMVEEIQAKAGLAGSW